MDQERFYKKVNKRYLHIDFPLSKKESYNYFNSLEIEENICQHRFLPFIHFNIVFKKHPNKTHKYNVKNRNIELSSHHDAGIYAYMADKLNDYYDRYVQNQGTSEVAVAYRTGKGISNITVAKEVFDYIDCTGDCWVMKGDFNSFFDNLNHCILNKNVMKVLNLRSEDLKIRTWKRILKNIERYSWIDQEKLIERMLENGIEINKRKYSYFYSQKEYGDFIKENLDLLNKNKKKGIPQGTGISAVLANVYMTNFDSEVSQLVNKLKGIYRRYSDDFIIVIPKNKLSELKFKELTYDIIELSSNEVKLTIEKNKTKVFRVHHGIVTDIKNKKETALDYLGFVLQNNTISIRPKSIYKFNYRGKRSVKAANVSLKMFNFLQENNNFDDVNDSSARELYDKLAEFNDNEKLSSMPVDKAQANINKTKRLMYHVKGNRGLPEYNKMVNGYLRDINESRIRESFLAYIKSADKIFDVGNYGYKLSFRKQTNKVRHRLSDIKQQIQ